MISNIEKLKSNQAQTRDSIESELFRVKSNRIMTQMLIHIDRNCGKCSKYIERRRQHNSYSVFFLPLSWGFWYKVIYIGIRLCMLCVCLLGMRRDNEIIPLAKCYSEWNFGKLSYESVCFSIDIFHHHDHIRFDYLLEN